VALLEHDFPLLRKNSIKQSHIVKQLIIDGLGIAFLPDMLIQKEVLEGRLNLLELNYSQFYIVDTYKRHLRENKQLLPLINFISEKNLI
jgi:LysR family transcriptional repressor of citA